MKNLFNFDSNSGTKTSTGSPKLVPAGGKGLFSSISKNFLKSDSITSNTEGMIDVVNEFHWTTSQVSSRQDVPAIMLKEMKLKTNSLYAQLAYYGLTVSESGGAVADRLGNLFSNSKLGGAFGNFLSNTGIGKSVLGLGETALGAISNFGSSLFGGSGAVEFFTGKSPREFLQQISSGSAGSNGVIAPYEGLYLTEDTKFVYRLPYFSNSANALANSFSDDDALLSGTAVGAGVGALKEAARIGAENIAAASNFMEPGIYIEKPKFYAFNNNGETVTFSFPLINTGWATFEDVQRNWQLIYMLVYQNRPNRKTRDLIDPPCIYEVMIPGVKFMPYAFISNLKVDFMGARRSYYINVPNNSGGTSKVQTIIPDAYMVTVSLQALVSETQNFLYHMLFEKQNIVNIIDTQSKNNSLDSILNGFGKGIGL